VQSVAIVVLAAGGSRRFGQPKQLVDWNGEPLLRSVVRSALSANADRVVVVLGAHASECAATLKDLAPAVGIQRIETVTNESWESGMASSIRAGVESAEKAGAEAPAFFWGTASDQAALAAFLAFLAFLALVAALAFLAGSAAAAGLAAGSLAFMGAAPACEAAWALKPIIATAARIRDERSLVMMSFFRVITVVA